MRPLSKRGVAVIPQTVERRRHERRTPEAELAIADISAMGALVEGTIRLAPGSRVDIHLMTRNGRLLVRSRVVRAYVFELRADRVGYRSALLFDQGVDTSAYGYSMPGAPDAPQHDSGTPYP